MCARIAIALIAALTGSCEALAAQRIYCVADDANLKMSLESGFSAEKQGALEHFRGVLTLKDSKVPGLVETMRLTSSMLKQHWMDGSELRLQVYTESQSGPFATLELTVDTAVTPDDKSRFQGGYTVKVQTGTDASGNLQTALSRDGRVVCELK
ncbi:hypothetical protein DFR48_103351 [Ciceribacter lividus]|uniref:Uncharacterized protein n=1 Tax=Ciceribacter lividus TaxID=1197950 RepID=A0A6I7HQY4_9HYPH|nr:hypothetical protein [Ciceribacter lividus]RCW27387.1 hypothetical protein DFR48_103351 [Ciceribacter lividus]